MANATTWLSPDVKFAITNRSFATRTVCCAMAGKDLDGLAARRSMENEMETRVYSYEVEYGDKDFRNGVGEKYHFWGDFARWDLGCSLGRGNI